MPTASRQKYRTHLAFLLVAAACGATAVAVFATPAEPSAATEGVLVGEADGFRYEYQILTGQESLYALNGDPKRLVNVLQSNAPAAARCRDALEKKLGVESLDSLRTRYDDEIRRLRALGYL